MCTSEDNELWTVKEVSSFLQVPERKVWNMLRVSSHTYGRLPVIEMDGKPRFLPSEIKHWKETQARKLRKLTPQEEYQRWRSLNPALE